MDIYEQLSDTIKRADTEQTAYEARIATLTARVTLLEKEKAELILKVEMLEEIINKAIDTGKTYVLEDYKWPHLADALYGGESDEE